METYDKILIPICVILIIALLGFLFYAFYESGKDNIKNEICIGKGGIPIEGELFETFCIKNDCILETVKSTGASIQKPAYRNTTFGDWSLYFVEYCPFEKDKDIRIGCTSWKKDIYIMGFRSGPDVMEICKHEVCHNLKAGTSLDYQEEFCARYSDTLNSVEEATYICNKLTEELDI